MKPLMDYLLYLFMLSVGAWNFGLWHHSTNAGLFILMIGLAVYTLFNEDE